MGELIIDRNLVVQMLEMIMVIGCIIMVFSGILNAIFYGGNDSFLIGTELAGLIFFGISFVIRIYIWLFIELKDLKFK